MRKNTLLLLLVYKFFIIFGYGETLKKLQSVSCFVAVLRKLWDSWEVSDNLMDELEVFMCASYGKPSTNSLNELHYIKLIQFCDIPKVLKRIYFANLPPCHRWLEQNIKCVNYLLLVACIGVTNTIPILYSVLQLLELCYDFRKDSGTSVWSYQNTH